jgi:hypothetical protein
MDCPLIAPTTVRRHSESLLAGVWQAGEVNEISGQFPCGNRSRTGKAGVHAFTGALCYRTGALGGGYRRLYAMGANSEDEDRRGTKGKAPAFICLIHGVRNVKHGQIC